MLRICRLPYQGDSDLSDEWRGDADFDLDLLDCLEMDDVLKDHELTLLLGVGGVGRRYGTGRLRALSKFFSERVDRKHKVRTCPCRSDSKHETVSSRTTTKQHYERDKLEFFDMA